MSYGRHCVCDLFRMLGRMFAQATQQLQLDWWIAKSAYPSCYGPFHASFSSRFFGKLGQLAASTQVCFAGLAEQQFVHMHSSLIAG